ncbi:hypothetical protein [Jeotgalibacillus marinus]|uniref:DUF1801 domain-containing protein n=1 Tax=Jeotgalibacillus marinus TaxID=86667 RepID=A0ABV3Q0R6_9BACL
METNSTFNETFEQLKNILVRHEQDLVLKKDTENDFYLDSNTIMEHNKKNVFFGAVQIKKNYVSFHLMPVYIYPELLEEISDDLKKRMHGKSCFNFKKPDLTLFEELRTLTEKGFIMYEKNNLI